MRTKPDEPGFKELSTILAQARRIAALFAEALDLARLPQGRSDALDLNMSLADVLNLAGHQLRKADVKAVLTCTMDSALIYAEASQLKQAFFNLVVDAAQLVGTGCRLHIVVAANQPGFLTLAFLGVDATGVGHDFSRSLAGFCSGAEEARTAGLGLYLAKEILDKVGATIEFTTSGQGTALQVCLPVNPGKGSMA